MPSIIYNNKDIPRLIDRLQQQEIRSCGLDTRATELQQKLQRIHRNSPSGCAVLLTYEEVEGLLV